MLDEPTTGLDPRSRQVVWSTIRSLVDDGVTLLLTTQYLEEADALADRVVLIDRGREVASGTPAQLKTPRSARSGSTSSRPTTPSSSAWVRCSASSSRSRPSAEQRTISIAAPDEADDLARVAAAVAEADVAVDEIALRRPTLDDAFLALTGTGARGPASRRFDRSRPTEVAA